LRQSQFWPACRTIPCARALRHRNSRLGKNRIEQGEGVFVSRSLTRTTPRENGLPYDELASGATIYAYVGNNPLIRTDPKGLACNGQGCWNTQQERDMANAGDYVGYYTTACANGDQYACQGLGVATDQGVLQGVTNYRLAWALSKNLPLGQTCKHDQEIIAQKMDLIRKALVKARADQLDALNASPDNPAQVDPQSIADFHHAIFTEYGAAPTVGGLPTFGGDLWGANTAMTITTGSGWCPSPACK